MRGPKANAGLPLWLQTPEQGKDRKMQTVSKAGLCSVWAPVLLIQCISTLDQAKLVLSDTQVLLEDFSCSYALLLVHWRSGF